MSKKQSAFVRKIRRNQLRALLGFPIGAACALLMAMLGLPAGLAVAIFAITAFGTMAYMAITTLGEDNCPKCSNSLHRSVAVYSNPVICPYCGANLSEGLEAELPGKS